MSYLIGHLFIEYSTVSNFMDLLIAEQLLGYQGHGSHHGGLLDLLQGGRLSFH